MKTPKPYVILSSYTPAGLEKMVARYLSEGYVLAGGVSKSWGGLAQSLVLRELTN